MGHVARLQPGALLLFLVLVVPAAHADSPAQPRDYSLPTQDGRHVFRMYASHVDGAGTRRSGLYAKGRDEPLWTVDWYAFRVELSPDGRYMLRRGPWAGSFDQLAIAFYERGKLLDAYAIHELVPDRDTVVYTVSHFFWMHDLDVNWRVGWASVATAGGTYGFDTTTGAMRQVIAQSVPQTRARITLADGDTSAVKTVLNCNPAMALALRLSHHAEPYIIGYSGPAGRPGGPGGMGRVTAIPVPLVRRVTAREVADRIVWDVRMKSGETHSLHIDDAIMALCVEPLRGKAGKRQRVSHRELVSIEMGETVAAPPRGTMPASARLDKLMLGDAMVVPVDTQQLRRQLASGTMPQQPLLRSFLDSAAWEGPGRSPVSSLTPLAQRRLVLPAFETNSEELTSLLNRVLEEVAWCRLLRWDRGQRAEPCGLAIPR